MRCAEALVLLAALGPTGVAANNYILITSGTCTANAAGWVTSATECEAAANALGVLGALGQGGTLGAYVDDPRPAVAAVAAAISSGE